MLPFPSPMASSNEKVNGNPGIRQLQQWRPTSVHAHSYDGNILVPS